MLYVGVDIHSKKIAICVLDENGKVFKRWTVKRVDQLMNLPSGLPDRFEVCYEASCGHGTF